MSERENTFTHTGILGTVFTLVYSEATDRWTWRNERNGRASAHYKTAESAQVFTRMTQF